MAHRRCWVFQNKRQKKLKSGRWRIREDRSYLAKIKKLTLKEWVGGGQGRLHKCSDTKKMSKTLVRQFCTPHSKSPWTNKEKRKRHCSSIMDFNRDMSLKYTLRNSPLCDSICHTILQLLIT